jgi:glycosyltransferase involved in cell wall biosynthesis
MKPGKILFISKGYEKPSTRYRARQFEKLLAHDGWQVRYVTASGNFFNKLKTLQLSRSSDVVVVLRKNFSAFFFQLLKAFSKKLIFDFDDANFLRPDGTPSKTRYDSFKRFMQHSDHVWAGNHYLAHEANKFCKNVSVIPTSIDPDKYTEKATKPDNHFDLVWIGSQSTSKYIKSLIPALEKVAELIPELRLKIIADFQVSSDKLKILSLPWSTDMEARELLSAHVGLAPLPDDPWTRGKCGLKVLQYMIAGLPVVSSNVGANAEILTDHKTGFLVTTDEQWLEAIVTLHKNKTLRETMGQQGLQAVKEKYSTRSVYQQLTNTLNTL